MQRSIIGGITTTISTTISNSAAWLHSHAKKVPVAGSAYTYLSDHIGSPLWNGACKVRDHATTFFKQNVMPVVRNHPWIAGAATLGFLSLGVLIHQIANLLLSTNQNGNSLKLNKNTNNNTTTPTTTTTTTPTTTTTTTPTTTTTTTPTTTTTDEGQDTPPSSDSPLGDSTVVINHDNQTTTTGN